MSMDSGDSRPPGYPFGPNDAVTPDHDAPRAKADYIYQPTQRRSSDQWGEPDDHLRFAQNYGAPVPGPHWPQIDQIGQTLAPGLQEMAQIGSINAQRNSLGSMSALVGYLKAQKENQDKAPQREMEALTLSLKKQAAELDAESRDYHDVLSRTNLSAPEKAQALWNIATKHNDENLRATLESGDMAGAEKMLAQRDARSQDYQKAAAALDAHQREEDAHRAAEEKYNNEEETKKNQDSPFQQKPSTYKPPGLGDFDGGGEGGGVPVPAIPSAPGAPAEAPGTPGAPGAPGAAPGAPGAPAAAPGAPAAAPADGNSGGLGIPGVTQATPQQDAPRVAQAGAPVDGGPMQYPPTALAGDSMSDAPPIGMRAGTQVAQAGGAPEAAPTPSPGGPQTLPQFDPENSPTLKAAATGPGHYINSPMIDELAQGMVMGTTKEAEIKATNPRVLPYVMGRAQEIRQKLDALSDPRNPATPQQTLDEVRKILPQFAGQLIGTVKGAIPPPTTSSRNPMAPYLAALGQKIDPTFDENQYRTRYAILRDLTQGKTAQYMRNLMTTEDHVELMRDLSRKIVNFSALGPNQNAYVQKMIAEDVPDWALDVASTFFGTDMREMRKNIIAYNTLSHQVAPEVARMQVGGNKPDVDSIRAADTAFGLGRPHDALEDQFRNIQSLTWHRVQETANSTAFYLNRFKTGPDGRPLLTPGGQRIPDGNTILAPFGRVLENPNYRYEDGSSPLPNREDSNLPAKLQHFINDPPPGPRPVTPGSLKGTGYSFEP